jgi:hypothetical protein
MKTTELVSFSEFTSNRALRKLQTAHLARLDHEGGSFKRNSDHNSLSRTSPVGATNTTTGTKRRGYAWPLQLSCSGPHREGEESKPMKHGQEKSDLFIVAVAFQLSELRMFTSI